MITAGELMRRSEPLKSYQNGNVRGAGTTNKWTYMLTCSHAPSLDKSGSTTMVASLWSLPKALCLMQRLPSRALHALARIEDTDIVNEKSWGDVCNNISDCTLFRLVSRKVSKNRIAECLIRFATAHLFNHASKDCMPSKCFIDTRA